MRSSSAWRMKIRLGGGESSAMPGAFYSHDTPDSCQRQLVEDALPKLARKKFSRTMQELEATLLDWGLSPFVRVAIETAAWEMLARASNQSLRSLFGLPDRPVQSGLAVGLLSDTRRTPRRIGNAIECLTTVA